MPILIGSGVTRWITRCPISRPWRAPKQPPRASNICSSVTSKCTRCKTTKRRLCRRALRGTRRSRLPQARQRTATPEEAWESARSPYAGSISQRCRSQTRRPTQVARYRDRRRLTAPPAVSLRRPPPDRQNLRCRAGRGSELYRQTGRLAGALHPASSQPNVARDSKRRWRQHRPGLVSRAKILDRRSR